MSYMFILYVADITEEIKQLIRNKDAPEELLHKSMFLLTNEGKVRTGPKHTKRKR